MCSHPFRYMRGGVDVLQDDNAVIAFGLHPGHDKDASTASKVDILAQQFRDAFTGSHRRDTYVTFTHELITQYKPTPKFDGRGGRHPTWHDFYQAI